MDYPDEGTGRGLSAAERDVYFPVERTSSAGRRHHRGKTSPNDWHVQHKDGWERHRLAEIHGSVEQFLETRDVLFGFPGTSRGDAGGKPDHPQHQINAALRPP